MQCHALLAAGGTTCPLVFILHKLKDLQRNGLGRLCLTMDQQTHLFGCLATEGLFATPDTDRCRNPVDQNILSVNLEDFLDQLFSALMGMTHRTCEHSYLRCE